MTAHLQEASANLGGPVIVATHNPQLLAIESATLLHLQKGPLGLSTISDLDADLQKELSEMAEALGVRPIDILQVYRKFLVIEGEHDRAVLENLFPGEWENARTRLLSMLGAKHAASTITAELLFEFTTADVVILLDNLVSDDFDATWEQVLRLASQDKRKAAKKQLDTYESRLKREQTAEMEWALGACRRALTQGRESRVHVWGLSKGDIIEYLDESHFGLNQSWSKLRAEYREHPDRRPFKDWLRLVKSADIGLKSIRKAARAASDRPPDELVSVLSKCRDLGGRN
ncbi:MAG: hypothetical protein GEU79_19150 [Acidimicrobiia bacterium]|nr:hypothetical protein [Acidimicrobiia bacterium]